MTSGHTPPGPSPSTDEEEGSRLPVLFLPPTRGQPGKDANALNRSRVVSHSLKHSARARRLAAVRKFQESRIPLKTEASGLSSEAGLKTMRSPSDFSGTSPSQCHQHRDGISLLCPTCNVQSLHDLQDISITLVGDGYYDPFTPSLVPLTPRLKYLLHHYMRVMVPQARSLIAGWNWLSLLPLIQTSLPLQYAIAAFCSAFLAGATKGAPAMVLPPSGTKEELLWPIPEWFRYQTNSIGLVNEDLASPAEITSDSTLHTVMMLLRLAILRCDREEADLHFKALQRLIVLRGGSQEELLPELSVLNVSMITALLDRHRVMIQTHRTPLGYLRRSVELDPENCPSSMKLPLQIAGRRLAWHSALSADVVECDNILVDDMLSNEPDFLSSPIFDDPSAEADIRTCCRIAIAIFTYLTGLVYNTSAPRIRLPLLHLVHVLERMEIESLFLAGPRVMTWLLYIGAYAAYRQPERQWLVSQLAIGTEVVGIKAWDHTSEVLNRFINLKWTHKELFMSIWEEIQSA